MSTDKFDAPAQLKRDFESYLNGGEPTALELACAPRLESWHATLVRFKPESDPLPMALVLVGRVTGHPRLPDAVTVHTSQLIWLDRNLKWARTWNRVYQLGERIDDEPVTPA